MRTHVCIVLKGSKIKKLNFVQHCSNTIGTMAADGEANLDVVESANPGENGNAVPGGIVNDEEEASQIVAESVEGQAALVQAHAETQKAQEVVDAKAKVDAEKASKIRKGVASAKAAVVRAKQRNRTNTCKTRCSCFLWW
jgi:hypothetical protein